MLKKQRLYGPHSLKYLLPGPLQKRSPLIFGLDSILSATSETFYLSHSICSTNSHFKDTQVLTHFHSLQSIRYHINIRYFIMWWNCLQFLGNMSKFYIQPCLKLGAWFPMSKVPIPVWFLKPFSLNQISM